MTTKNERYETIVKVEISTEYIKLDQLLKFSAVVSSGADAKDVILSDLVSVNGEICTMRGKKIRPGDTVSVDFDDEIIEITVE